MRETTEPPDLHDYGYQGLCAAVVQRARRDVIDLMDAGLVSRSGVVADPWPRDKRGDAVRAAHDYNSAGRARDLMRSFGDGRLDVWMALAGVHKDGEEVLASSGVIA